MGNVGIKNRIIKNENLDVERLTPFQGGLKTISETNYNKLRTVIIDEGFCFTVHVWQSGEVIYIIDGHQRIEVMKKMRLSGYDIPAIPCAFIQAKTYHDAKKLVLLAVSQYGKVDSDGFLEFIDGEDFNLEDFDLPDFEIPDIVMPDSEPNEKDDDVPDVVDNPYGVKRGDVWLLGAYYECPECKKEYTVDEGKEMKGECACA